MSIWEYLAIWSMAMIVVLLLCICGYLSQIRDLLKEKK